MRVAITGGAGSLGRELVCRLVERQMTVVVMDLPGSNTLSLRRLDGVEVCEGSIADTALLRHALSDADAVVHLAALLPPVSERDRETTMAVNVEGTRGVVDAMQRVCPHARLVFSSSVCVYGDTSTETPPVDTSHPLLPMDVYSESKAAAECVVAASGLPYVVARISGIAVPAFLAPPDPWPFLADQRIEYICREDVVTALAACVTADGIESHTLNIAGGGSWRLRGGEFVAGYNEVMGLAPDDAGYRDTPGAFDWYATDEAQVLLGYQRTPYPRFLEMLGVAVEKALGGEE